VYNNIYGKVYLCLLYKYISDEKFVTVQITTAKSGSKLDKKSISLGHGGKM